MKSTHVKETAIRLRQTVPLANLGHFNAAVQSVTDEMDSDPATDSDLLLAWLWDRTQRLQVQDMANVPPALAPRPYETVEQAVEREYLTAGYRIRVQA